MPLFRLTRADVAPGELEDLAQSMDRLEYMGAGSARLRMRSALLRQAIGEDDRAALDVAAGELSARYKMDFRRAAERYVALGRPEDVAEWIAEFHRLGVRHVVLDMVSPDAEVNDQIARFAEDTRPLLASLG